MSNALKAGNSTLVLKEVERIDIFIQFLITYKHVTYLKQATICLMVCIK